MENMNPQEKIGKVIKSSDKPEQDFGIIKVQELLNDVENMSVAVVKIDGVNKKTTNRKSDSAYYIVEGQGVFNINGVETEVGQGDLVFIPKGTPYFDSGKMTLVAFNNPSFDRDEVETD